MIKIAICDDDPAMAAQIETCISELPLQDLQCEVYASGDELMAHLQQGLPERDYHIYFLDIEMPGRNGYDTADRPRAPARRAR